MSSTLILFKEIGRQLLIVGLVLGSLPMAIRILWKLRLLPLGCSGRAGRKHTEQSASCFLSLASCFLP